MISVKPYQDNCKKKKKSEYYKSREPNIAFYDVGIDLIHQLLIIIRYCIVFLFTNLLTIEINIVSSKNVALF